MQMQVIARTTTVTSFTAEAKGLPKDGLPTTTRRTTPVRASVRHSAGRRERRRPERITDTTTSTATCWATSSRTPIRVPGADAFYTHEKGRNIFNGWLSHRVRLGGTSLAGSANLAGSPYGTFPSWSLSVTQQIMEGWSADANATPFHAPPDLYGPILYQCHPHWQPRPQSRNTP